MQRRKFLATVGSLAAGSAAAMGTGAFTSVQAKRTVSVDVVGDGSAYLKLSSDGTYVSNDNNDEFTIDLGAVNNGNGGEGFNQDAATVIHSVFTISNQGTNSVSISLQYSGNGKVVTEVDSADLTWSEGVYFELRDGGETYLEPGESETVDVAVVEKTGADTVSGGSLTINANAQ